MKRFMITFLFLKIIIIKLLIIFLFYLIKLITPFKIIKLQ